MSQIGNSNAGNADDISDANGADGASDASSHNMFLKSTIDNWQSVYDAIKRDVEKAMRDVKSTDEMNHLVTFQTNPEPWIRTWRDNIRWPGNTREIPDIIVQLLEGSYEHEHAVLELPPICRLSLIHI